MRVKDKAGLAHMMNEGSFRTLCLGATTHDGGDMPAKVRAALTGGPWVMLAFSCKGGAHAVGVAASPDEGMALVFDPNYGAAAVSMDNKVIGDFLELVVGELVKDYSISKGWASACFAP
jgi:hypothetical protein